MIPMYIEALLQYLQQTSTSGLPRWGKKASAHTQAKPSQSIKYPASRPGGILEVASQHSEGASAEWPLLDQFTPQPKALQHTKSKDVSKDENMGSLRQNHGKTILAVIQTTAILSSVVSMLIRIFPLCLLHVPRPLCWTTWLLFVSEVKTYGIDGNHVAYIW